MGKRPRQPGPGFTLIELLVVVSIVALLIALLLPALQGAKIAANAVACLSNHKQIGIAMMQYVDDNNRVLPHAHNFVSGQLGTWRSKFSEYMSDNDVWQCPNAAVDEGQHYSSNPSVMREHRSGDPEPRRYDAIARFSEVVVAFDGAQQSPTNGSAQQQGKIDRNAGGSLIVWGKWLNASDTDNDTPVDVWPNSDFWSGNNVPKHRARWRENGLYPEGDHNAARINLLYSDGHAEGKTNGDFLRKELRPGTG